MDGNVHGGPKLIENDPNFQNYNGKLFEQAGTELGQAQPKLGLNFN